AVKDQNSDIRIAGLRIASELKLDLIPLLKILVKDSSAQVRRECALSLRHNSSSEAPELWAQLAQQHDGKNRWYLEALGIGADKNEDKFFAAWLEAARENWNTFAGHDIIWRSRSPKALPYLTKIIRSEKTSKQERPRYFRALDFIPQCPEKEIALLELLTLVGH
ncbi:MAG: dehydrogenase, partial [Verrucomicrobiota bacterium]|nr:dehydrogenase [Verrucomicrobiota bacterium]